MNVRRGDVVLVVYPFASGRGASRRPALIVQNDRDNSRLTNGFDSGGRVQPWGYLEY